MCHTCAWDASHHMMYPSTCLWVMSSPQEYTLTGLNKLAGTSANIESWESSAIPKNPQESCRSLWGTIKISTSGHVSRNEKAAPVDVVVKKEAYFKGAFLCS